MAAPQMYQMLPQLTVGPPTQPAGYAIPVQVHPLACTTLQQLSSLVVQQGVKPPEQALLTRRERDKEGRRKLRELQPERYDEKLASRRERERLARLRERETGAEARIQRLEKRRAREKDKRQSETPEERTARLLKRRKREERRNSIQDFPTSSSTEASLMGNELVPEVISVEVHEKTVKEGADSESASDSLLEFMRSMKKSINSKLRDGKTLTSFEGEFCAVHKL
eukprot:TRINITY_DN8705_c0_g1_i15.p1 TRINITY_DN8705_c0_g1~~TRINITY_DN8705_c0_g1_i15.p1  ORF type:complete len:225 (+),score=34.11 TRINITY_DN8705_c0_g1_i15:115-789(+)